MPSPPENLSAQQNLALGVLFSSAGAYEQAIPRFEEALRLDPTNDAATANLALAYKNAGKDFRCHRSAPSDGERTAVSRPFTTCWAGWMRNRASLWRRCRAFSEPWNSIPTTNNIISISAWSISRTSPSGRRRKSIESARRSFPSPRGNILGWRSVIMRCENTRKRRMLSLRRWRLIRSHRQSFRPGRLCSASWRPRIGRQLLPRLDRLAAAHPQNAELAFAYGAALFRLEVSKGQEGAFDRSQTLLEKVRAAAARLSRGASGIR